MRWEIKLNTDAATEPVSTADAKTHLRVTDDSEDEYIASLVKAARMQVENTIGRALVTQTWELHLADWPLDTFIRLPRAPLQSVSSIQYMDIDGNTDTVADTVYGVDSDSTPGRIYLKPNQTWPGESLYEGTPITITYIAGYGDSASDVPQALVHAIKLLIGDLYENRETTIVGSIITVSKTVESLIWPYRLRSVYP